jgi:hypothetical protein
MSTVAMGPTQITDAQPSARPPVRDSVGRMTDTDATGTQDFQQIFSDDDPVDVLWVKAYQGEVLGEALFGRMAELMDDEDHVAKMRMLAKLERRTKEAIAPAVERAGQRFRGLQRLVVGLGREAGAASTPWKDLMATFEPITSQFCTMYRRIGELDPSEKESADLLVAHELALRGFARAEVAGDTETSLDQITALAHMQ